MYIHSRRSAETGLHFNNWKEEMHFFKLEAGNSYTFSLSKRRFTRLDQGDCAGGMGFEDYVDCVVSEMREEHIRSSCQRGKDKRKIK